MKTVKRIKPNTPLIWQMLREKHITLYGISKKYHIYSTQLSNFLNDSGYISQGTARKIMAAFSDVLGVPVDELVLKDEDAA